MASRYYSNIAAKTTLAASIGTTDTQIQLSSTTGMPTLYPFTLILEKDTANEEIVTVTSLTGSVYNILRGVAGGDGTTARSHTAGTSVEHGVSARDFADSRTHESATSGAHGITGSFVGTTDAQTVSNKTFTATERIGFDTVSPTATAAAGDVAWNTSRGTLDVRLNNGVTLQVGQEDHVYVRNQTGVTIPDMTLVMVTGVHPGSAAPTIAPAVTNGSVDGHYMLGVTTEDITNNGYGYVTVRGEITTNTSAWAEGTILYNNPAVAGGFTTTPPAAPNLKLPVAFVTYSHAVNGRVMVRMTTGSVLGGTDSNVQITAPANGQFLKYNTSTSRWENVTASPMVTLSGDVTGSATLTNLGNATITATVGDDSHSHTSATLPNLTEDVQDIAGAMITGGINTGITASYNDTTGTVSFAVTDLYVNTAGDTMSGNLIMGGNKVTNIGAPTAAGDAVDKSTLDAHTSSTTAHGATGAVAGTTNTQTFTNKTIDGTTNTLQNVPQSAVTNLVADLASKETPAGAQAKADSAETDAKAYTDAQIAILTNGSPELLNTLDELAAALGDDPNFATTITNQIATKVAKAGDTMTGTLTFTGGAKVTGLPAPTVDADAATKLYVDNVAGTVADAEAAAAAAEAAYDAFDDRYLGAKASDPTTDNDGNALLTGALYWNTAGAEMRVWDGDTWEQMAPKANFFRWTKTAAGSETSLSGNDDYGVALAYNVNATYLYLNGTMLVKGVDYTATTGTSVTGLAALAAGDIVEIISLPALVIADAIMATVWQAKGDLLVGSASVTTGRLPVGADGTVLMADSSQPLGLKYGTVDLTSIEIMSVMGSL